MLETIKYFPDFHGVGAGVSLVNKEGKPFELQIHESGLLEIPEGVVPEKFNLILTAEEDPMLVFAQKNVGRYRGEYHRNGSLCDEMGGVTILETKQPIVVSRTKDGFVRTAWHNGNSNRIDCWYLWPNGKTDLVQIGIVTHDNGQSFRLVKDWVWRGEIFYHTFINQKRQKEMDVVGVPDAPHWGTFEIRKSIAKFPPFVKAMKKADIGAWKGSKAELEPVLPPVPENDAERKIRYARVLWYRPFGGRAGQGIAVLKNGEHVWIHGEDANDLDPDEDGVKRLYWGDMIEFPEKAIGPWGYKKGPAKIFSYWLLERVAMLTV